MPGSFYSIVLVFLGLILLGQPSFAQAQQAGDKAAQPKYSVAEVRVLRQKVLATMDSNGDGAVSLQELTNSISGKFAGLDRNRDDVLSPDEIQAALKAFETQKKADYAASYPNYERRYLARFKQMDKNGNGLVSRKEYEDYYKKRYESFDRDSDGIITNNEFRMDEERSP